MNYENDDPLGLKKLEKTLSDLGKFDKPKSFDQPKPVYTKGFQSNQAKRTLKQDAQSGVNTAKIVLDETKKTINAFKKMINKNKIPKGYKEVLEMLSRLQEEERQRVEIKRAIEEIKTLQAKKKEDEKN